MLVDTKNRLCRRVVDYILLLYYIILDYSGSDSSAIMNRNGGTKGAISAVLRDERAGYYHDLSQTS